MGKHYVTVHSNAAARYLCREDIRRVHSHRRRAYPRLPAYSAFSKTR